MDFPSNSGDVGVGDKRNFFLIKTFFFRVEDRRKFCWEQNKFSCGNDEEPSWLDTWLCWKLIERMSGKWMMMKNELKLSQFIVSCGKLSFRYLHSLAVNCASREKGSNRKTCRRFETSNPTTSAVNREIGCQPLLYKQPSSSGRRRLAVLWLKVCLKFSSLYFNFAKSHSCSALCCVSTNDFRAQHRLLSCLYIFSCQSIHHEHENVVCSIKMRFAYIFLIMARWSESEKANERREYHHARLRLMLLPFSADVSSILTANDFFILNFRYVYASLAMEWRNGIEQGWRETKKFSWRVANVNECFVVNFAS